MPKEYLKETDYELLEISLVSSSGEKINIESVFVELFLYEDIFSPVTSGSVKIFDTTSLLETLPIIGEEKLILRFSTSQKEFPVYSKVFDIYKVSDVKNERKKLNYILHFTSEIMEINLQKRISKHYNGYPHEIVQSIYSKFLNQEQDLTYELVTGQPRRDIVFPNMRGLKAIEYICKTTVRDGTYPSSNFLFFESRTGFNFTSVERLLEKETSCELLFQGDKQIEAAKTSKINYVIDWLIHKSFDSLENMDRGMYGNTVITHDIINKKISTKKHRYYDEFWKQSHTEENGRELISGNREYLDESQIFFKSSNYDNVNSIDWAGIRPSQLSQLNSIVVHATVPGNTEELVGNKIKFKIPTYEFEEFDNDMKFLSGHFLITKIKHTLTKHKYVSTYELRKDSLNNKGNF